MRVAIIDADLIGRKKHRFPNLVCMKLSAYHKIGGADVFLKTDYDHLELFDKVFISKVFTDTPELKYYTDYSIGFMTRGCFRQYESLYNNIARWCNQPAFFTKKSFHEFAKIREGGIGWRTMLKAESEIDGLIKYFDMKWKE